MLENVEDIEEYFSKCPKSKNNSQKSKIEKLEILIVRNSGESGLSATSTSSPGAGCDAGHPQLLPQGKKTNLYTGPGEESAMPVRGTGVVCRG